MTDQLPVNLLAEETMVDPSSTLPSFFEMKLVDATTESGKKSLLAVLDTLVAQLQVRLLSSPHGTIRRNIYTFLHKILRNYRDEIQAMITFTIEHRILLSKAGATLSESMYGLKRSRIRNGNVSEMSKVDRTRVALLLAVGPYLKKRMDEWYERQRHERFQTGDFFSNRIGHQFFGEKIHHRIEKLKTFVRLLYPWFRFSYNSVDLAYKFAYLMGKSVHYNPSLHAFGMVIRRITSSELSYTNATLPNDRINPKGKDVSSSMITTKRLAAYSLVSALVVGWVGKLLKEIRKHRHEEIARSLNQPHHYTSSHTHHPNEERFAISIPPPASPPSLNQSDISIHINQMRCPICHEPRINPVASSSGYVFCYKCIVLYMKEHGNHCPVTGRTCTISQLVRLYEPTKSEHNT
jgi:hypothetical protein